MEYNIKDKKRSIIPRWRDFHTTLALGELAPVRGHRIQLPSTGDGSLASQLADWNRNKSLAFATDLVGSALALGITTDIEEAAQFVLSPTSNSTDLQRRIATLAIDPSASNPSATDLRLEASSDEVLEQSRSSIRNHREALRQSLRNPIRLVELARSFAVLGSIDKAVRTMNVAVALAPANRFVLRAAARLYVHADDYERAHQILKRAPSLKEDPWIMAAEIAVASMRNIDSSNVGRGIRLIENKDYAPFDISELSSAAGTVEMSHGKFRNARKLFRQALTVPTDNSIAQVEWASRNSVGIDVEISRSHSSLNFEGPAWHFYTSTEFEEALKLGRNWILDQPFAATPVLFTGMIANFLDKADLAERIFRFGLQANPEHGILRNNLAFTLASNNAPELAQEELERIDRSSLDQAGTIIVTATEGLIKFRSGATTEGRHLYREAMRMASKNNLPSYRFRALMYLTREEIRSKSLTALESYKQLQEQSRAHDQIPEFKVLNKQLSQEIASLQLEPGRKQIES